MQAHGHGGSNQVYNIPGHTSQQPSALTTSAQSHQSHASHVSYDQHQHDSKVSARGRRSGRSLHGEGLGHKKSRGPSLPGRARGLGSVPGRHHLPSHIPLSRHNTTLTQIIHQPSAASSIRSFRSSMPSTRDSRMGARGDWDRPDINKAQKKEAEKQQKLDELKNLTQVSNQLARKTHFTAEEIQALVKIHKKLTAGSNGKLDRMRFRDTMYGTLGVTDDVILDRMYALFDGETSGSVSVADFVLALNAILRGTLDEQIAYSYEMYDINGDRGIGRDELHHFLKNCITPIAGVGLQAIDPDEVTECVHDIVELALKKLDVDGNGTITYGDFYDAVQRDPLLLEALGPCFPRDQDKKTFLSIFGMDYNNFNSHGSPPNDLGWDRERDKFARKKEINSRLRKERKLVKGGPPPLLTFRDRKKTQPARNTVMNRAASPGAGGSGTSIKGGQGQATTGRRGSGASSSSARNSGGSTKQSRATTVTRMTMARFEQKNKPKPLI